MTRITVTVDGVDYSDDVEPRTLLVQYLREQLGQDRHRRRLRHEQLRRLHRPPRRPQREVVHRARRPGRRARGHHDRGPGAGRRAAPDAAGLPRVPRAAVRLLHAGHDHAGASTCSTRTRTPPRRRSATGSRATCAGAPATTTSSRPCSMRRHGGRRRPRRRGDSTPGGGRHDRRRRPPDRRDRRRAQRKEDQRLITGRTRWTDNIQLPGHAAPRHGAQPVRPRHDHRHRHRGGQGGPGRRRGLHRRGHRRHPGRRCPTPGRSRPTRRPPAPPADRRRPRRLRRRDRRRRRRPHRGCGPRRRRAGRRRLRRAAGRRSTSRRPPTDAVLAHPDLGTNKSRVLAVRLRPTAGTGGDVDEAIAKARDDGIVIEREYRQQRLIPAFMEPRSTVVDPTGEQITIWSATQIPHILRFFIAATHSASPSPRSGSSPPTSAAASAASCRSRPRSSSPSRRARSSASRASTPRPARESLVSGPPRPRPVAEAHPGRHQGRHGHRPEGRPARRHGRLPRRSSAAACPMLGAFMFNAIYKFPAYRFNCTNVFTNKTWTDAYRGAGRPEATYAIERIMDELAAEVGRRPARDPREELDQARGVPVHHGRGHDLRLRQLRGGHRQGQGALRLRRAAGRAEAAPRAATTRSSSASASRRSPRCAAWPRPGCSAACNYGAGGWEHADGPDAADRQGRGRHRARRRTARATRRRGARSSPTGSASRSRTSRSCTATPRSRPRAWTPTARARSSSAARPSCWPPTRSSRRPSRSRRTCSRPRVDDLEFAGGTFSVKGTDKGMAIAEVALAAFTGHNLPDGIEPTLDADATYDPVNFSFPHGTHLCAMEVDTETGAVTMRKYVCVDDIGNIINPLIVEGQVHGGLVQGIAQALWEEAVYDDAGHPRDRARSSTTRCRPRPTRSSFVTDHTDVAVDDQRRSAPRASARPAPSPRPRRSSTPSSTRCGHFGVNDILMPCTPERVWKAIQSAGRRPGRRRRPRRPSRTSTPTRPTRTPAASRDGRSRPVIPAAFDYLAPTIVDEALAALAEAGDDAKVHRRRPEPAAHPADAAQRTRDGHRPRPDRGAARHPRRRRRPRHRRDDHVRRRAGERRSCASTRRCSPRRSPRWPTRRSGTAARSAARWCTPTRPATSARRCSRSTPSSSSPGRGGERTVRGGRLLPGPLRDGRRRGRAAHRDPDPEAHRLGRALREVRPGRPTSGRSSRSPRRSGPTAARSPRPGSG